MRKSDIVTILCGMLLICGIGYKSYTFYEQKQALKALRAEVAHSDAVRSDLVQRVTAAWKKSDYAALENMHQAFVTTNKALPSGSSTVSVFYRTISDLITKGGEPKDEGYWTMVQKSTIAWNAAYPRSTAPILIQALAEYDQGWAFRGSGYMNTVGDNGYMAFQAHLGRAAELLQKAQMVAETDPYWYDLAVGVMRGGESGRKGTLEVLKAGIAQHPGYYSAMFEGLMVFHPEWGGDAEMEDAAIRELAAAAGEGAPGDILYAMAYEHVADVKWNNELFTRTLADWTRVKVGFKAMTALYPDVRNLNRFAHFACMAGDKESATSLLQTIGQRIVPSAWGAVDAYWMRCSDWALGTHLLLPSPTTSEAELLKMDEQLEVGMVRMMAGSSFITRDFRRLEELTQKYSSTKATYPSGRARSGSLYLAFSDMMRSMQIGTFEELWAETSDIADEWLKTFPDSTGARLAKTQGTIDFALSFHGPGHTVFHPAPPPTQAARMKMEVALDMAKKQLEEIKPVAGREEEWYVQMMIIASEQRWTAAQTEALFMEAVAADPYYRDFYEFGGYYLTQAWARERMDIPGKIEALARYAAQITGAKEGQGYYAVTYDSLSGTLMGNQLFQVSYADWAIMKQGLQDLHKNHPSPRNLNNLAKFACLAKDPATAKAALQKIKVPDEGVWIPKIMYTDCAKFVGVRRGI